MVQLQFYKARIASFCEEHNIRKLMVYGGALHPDFRPEDEIDILVEFEADHIPGLFALVNMERKLAALLDGRKVDMRTAQDFSRTIRQDVLEEAEVRYEKG